jgi:hypothetical protein
MSDPVHRYRSELSFKHQTRHENYNTTASRGQRLPSRFSFPLLLHQVKVYMFACGCVHWRLYGIIHSAVYADSAFSFPSAGTMIAVKEQKQPQNCITSSIDRCGILVLSLSWPVPANRPGARNSMHTAASSEILRPEEPASQVQVRIYRYQEWHAEMGGVLSES